MTNLYEMVQAMRRMSRNERRIHLDMLIERTMRGDERLRSSRLDFNANLFTALREEKLWPPTGSSHAKN